MPRPSSIRAGLLISAAFFAAPGLRSGSGVAVPREVGRGRDPRRVVARRHDRSPPDRSGRRDGPAPPPPLAGRWRVLERGPCHRTRARRALPLASRQRSAGREPSARHCSPFGPARERRASAAVPWERPSPRMAVGPGWPGRIPPTTASRDGHGYVDAAAGPDGALYLAWLDSRDGGQGLRAAVSRDGGRTWSANASVDTRTCECCWNSLLSRGRMRLFSCTATRTRGTWRWRRRRTAAAPGHAARWWAPSTGRSTAARTWGAAWPRPERGRARSSMPSRGQVRRSAVASTCFLPRRGSDLGRAAAVGNGKARNGSLAGSGRILALTWDEAGSIQVAVSADADGRLSRPRRLGDVGARASHPIVVASSLGFRVFWTESRPGEPSRLGQGQLVQDGDPRASEE